MKLTIPTSDIEAHVFSWMPDALDARMYLLRCGNEVLCVDPHRSDEADTVLKNWNTNNITIVLTHEHFDHISGVNTFRSEYECNVVCTRLCSISIKDPNKNLSKYALVLCTQLAERKVTSDEVNIQPFSCSADTFFDERIDLHFSTHRLSLFAMPGHSKGGLCMLLDNAVIFTGDNLVPHTPVVTRLPGGDKEEYYQFTLPFLKKLSGDLTVLPGHHNIGRLDEMLKALHIS